MANLLVYKSSDGKYYKLSDKTKVIVGSSESMSKSKKNVVDPESMIKSYGADADGLFFQIVRQKKIFNGLIKE